MRVKILPPHGSDRSMLDERSWADLPAAEHVAFYEAKGYTNKEALKLAAADRGVSRREIYAELLKTL